MRMKLIFAVPLLCLLLAGCKPPKFDSEITCPGFHARGVAVYDQGGPLLGVVYPDHSFAKVDRTECVIRPAEDSPRFFIIPVPSDDSDDTPRAPTNTTLMNSFANTTFTNNTLTKFED
jgi:hypothetical protein